MNGVMNICYIIFLKSKYVFLFDIFSFLTLLYIVNMWMLNNDMMWHHHFHIVSFNFHVFNNFLKDMHLKLA